MAMKRVAKEMRALHKEQLDGVTVLPGADHDALTVTAVIDGPVDTPYEGGQFKVRLRLTDEYPHAPPKGTFVTTIFHPNVGPKGDICVNTLKRDWSSDKTIKDVLMVIKCLLIVPNPESALNEEAGRQLLEAYDDYCAQARLMTQVHASKRLVQAPVA
eukprot:CAMPEP_0198307616 /NCGR_PEP_ID=MMETSP1450-20131203/449_1 /TAXON_ID=753684 ORGANISM="Madagascaria erythrocladiodes, Strain CCMP3234" /NCGR_SAMPLE_ID=MMETSP1450 /ASSEMBLY_ACC=CAM_ASM_001115 /LENGTH=157 /DNA_ID=CAMNT_0044010205 /DNA_START=98 /DNA_END=567 /DNA_ORIENTATION=-